MPTHNPVPIDPLPILLDRPAQPKVCASCQSSLIDPQSSIFLSTSDGPVCPGCRERIQATLPNRLESRAHWTETPARYAQPTSYIVGNISQNTRHLFKQPLFNDDEMLVDVPAPTSRSCHTHSFTNSSNINSKKLTSLTIPCNTTDNVSTAPLHETHGQSQTTTTHLSRRQTQLAQYPSPLTDITRLRVRSNGSDYLYPGATFQGQQKSGRNNYDVDVTIVDVNFSSSYLCGYLRIRGLTDDHPDLTTYFDAEIIGSRYGFLTRNWGATEQEDLMHWARFPAFHDIKDELKRPHMKLADRDRSIVFMRWKERFLVPNHRVSEINGASFAGFYYICVDFNPSSRSSARSSSQQLPVTPENVEMPSFDSMSKSEAPRQSRRDSIDSTERLAAERVPSLASRGPPAAKMTGFYYHRNSEPYQQLNLSHVAERVGSSFELR